MAEAVVLAIVPQMGKALLNLKDKYDQHSDNKDEIKELQLFIQDYDAHFPAIEKRFRQGGGNDMGVVVLKRLEQDLAKAADRLRNWSTSRNFFRVLTSSDRMKKLEHLHKRLMASVQMNLGIASLSTLMDVRDGQATILDSILDSKAELKSLVTEGIRSVAGNLLREVRAEAVQASQASFADQKFWEDVLAAVNQREADAETYFYRDPMTFELMIDPVVASNGHTFCRWTIIDKGMQKDPYSGGEDLTILVDNLLVRSMLFEEFPAQEKEFRERREEFRRNALALASKQLFGDAAVALQHILLWDKNDKGCAEVLLQVQEALKRDQYVSSSECESDHEMRKLGRWRPGHGAVDVGLKPDVSAAVITKSRADAVGGLSGVRGVVKKLQPEASSPKAVDGINRQDHHLEPERTPEDDLHNNRESWVDPKSRLDACRSRTTEWTSHGPEYSPSEHDVSSHESGGGARTTHILPMAPTPSSKQSLSRPPGYVSRDNKLSRQRAELNKRTA